MVEILSVDDDEGIRYTLKKVLSKEGHNVETVDSGEACLKYLENKKPDLILLDVMMPGLNGWETLEKIKTDPSTKDIPVIMVTVKSTESDKDRSFGHMAEGHVPKPIVKEELLAAISWVFTPKFE